MKTAQAGGGRVQLSSTSGVEPRRPAVRIDAARPANALGYSLRDVRLHREADETTSDKLAGAARFHVDERAAGLARAAQARAVTIGRDVYFGRGEFRPETSAGRELITHELVHVAQAARGMNATDEAGAEREARHIARSILSPGALALPVRHAAAPIMFDRIPEPDLNQDKATIAGELLLKYPYLGRLSNRDGVLDAFADHVRFKRRAMELDKQLAKLPSITQGLTSAIRKRERERAPLERQWAKNAKDLRAVSTSVVINPLEILGPAFHDTRSKAFVAGCKAVAQELSKRKVWLTVARGGFDTFGFGITGYIDGVWLPIREDGINPLFFKVQGYATSVMLEIEHAFLTAIIDVQEQDLASFVDQAPYVAEHALDTMIEEAREARRIREEPTAEERMVLEMKAERKAYAANVAEAATSAVAPLILLASFFAIEGPLDLLLTVAPVHKLGKAFKLGKQALGKKGTKALEKIGKELLQHLDDESKFFLKLASKLSKAEVRALKVIFKHTESPAVIKTLMQRHLSGTADVRWIAKKLEKKKLDGKFVAEFTSYPANPSWKVLEDVVEGRKVVAEARSALAGHVKGFLAEEAAETAVKVQSMLGAIFRKRKGAKILRIERSVKYGATESMDLLALSDKAELLFGEVKHWSAATWASATERAETLAQLERHNAGIEMIRKQLSRRKSDVTDRVLYVSKNGFNALGQQVRDKFKEQVKALGWTIEEMRDEAIADFKGLIDRTR